MAFATFLGASAKTHDAGLLDRNLCHGDWVATVI